MWVCPGLARVVIIIKMSTNKDKVKANGSVAGAIERVTTVQVDGAVALKIIKHCQEEGTGAELIQGFLVGLVVGSTLQVTNSFPFPKALVNSKKEDQYQRDILISMKKVNGDYHQVGWYQSTYLGPHYSREFLVSHFGYQSEIEESVVIVYDPLKTALGNLSLRAFRLTPLLLDLLRKNDQFTPESVQEAGLRHNDLFDEIPVTLKNSHLTSGLLNMLNPTPSFDLLQLSTTQHLECHMLQLIDYVELLQQETYKMLGYERNSVKQQQMKQQFIQKRKEENLRRAKDNEPLLPLDEKTIEKELNMKPSHAPPRQQALLTCEQVQSQCNEVLDVTGQSFSKLYLAESLQQH